MFTHNELITTLNIVYFALTLLLSSVLNTDTWCLQYFRAFSLLKCCCTSVFKTFLTTAYIYVYACMHYKHSNVKVVCLYKTEQLQQSQQLKRNLQ